MSRLDGQYSARLRDTLVMAIEEMIPRLVDLITASDVPPGMVPVVDEGREFIRLSQLRDQGDPIYWEHPEAQQRLKELEQRFGSLQPQIGAPGTAPTTQVQPPTVPNYITGTADIARNG